MKIREALAAYCFFELVGRDRAIRMHDQARELLIELFAKPVLRDESDADEKYSREIFGETFVEPVVAHVVKGRKLDGWPLAGTGHETQLPRYPGMHHLVRQ